MTAAPQDADLGLNLVFESAPAPVPKAARAPTKKRKNKYDRRREKGRLAKLAKEGDADNNNRVAVAEKEKTACSSGTAGVEGTSTSGAPAIDASDVSPKDEQKQKQPYAPKVSDALPSVEKIPTQQNTVTNDNDECAKPSIAKTIGTTSDAIVSLASSRRKRVSVTTDTGNL